MGADATPHPDRPELSMDPGDHWFTDYEQAFTAGLHLVRVRLVEREAGQIVKETPIL